MSVSDFGILIESIGFIFLILSAGRNPYAVYRVDDSHKNDKITIVREKLIPDRFVIRAFLFSIISIIAGLILQLSPFR